MLFKFFNLTLLTVCAAPETGTPNELPTKFMAINRKIATADTIFIFK